MSKKPTTEDANPLANLKLKNRETIEKYASDILNDDTFKLQKEYLQHGKVSVYDHVIYVADKSLSYAKRLHLKISEKELVRGALLHDYYLYDWHIHGAFYRGHIIRHPREAAEKARQDFKTSKKEENSKISSTLVTEPEEETGEDLEEEFEEEPSEEDLFEDEMKGDEE